MPIDLAVPATILWAESISSVFKSCILSCAIFLISSCDIDAITPFPGVCEAFFNLVAFLIKNEVTEDLLNIGTGEEISIKELSKEIQQVTKFNGELIFNNSFPDGNPRKLLASSKMLKLGWQPEISLKEGLADTYSWSTSNY